MCKKEPLTNELESSLLILRILFSFVVSCQFVLDSVAVHFPVFPYLRVDLRAFPTVIVVGLTELVIGVGPFFTDSFGFNDDLFAFATSWPASIFLKCPRGAAKSLVLA